ncbi:MAG TPA: nitrilase family protein [Armatimonadota bacterium]|nr:nitrilase family protein [Armatimonadota bacterium]
MRDIRVASVQFEHASGDKEANLAKVRQFTEAAAQAGCEMVIFPECCLTGYWFLRNLSRDEVEAIAEPVPGGPLTDALKALSRESAMTVGAGLVEIDGDTMYNTYVVAMPCGTIRKHRKIHAFISAHVECGSEYTVFDTPHGFRAGVLTCYDNNIGENARITRLMGAEILIAPHQTGGCDSPDPHTMGLVDRELWDNREADPEAIEAELRGDKGRGWMARWLPARAHDNGMFLIFSNGVGYDDDEIRTGNAMILDPYGRMLAETWKAGDDMVVADLDAGLMERTTGARWIKTRRPDLYSMISTPTGLEEDTRKVRFDKKGV